MRDGNPLTNWDQPLSRRSVLRGAGAVLASAVPGVVGGPARPCGGHAGRGGRQAAVADGDLHRHRRYGPRVVAVEEARAARAAAVDPPAAGVRARRPAPAQRPVAPGQLREPQRPRELRLPAPDGRREGGPGRGQAVRRATSRSTRPPRGSSGRRRSCRRWRWACRTTRRATRSGRPRSRSLTRRSPARLRADVPRPQADRPELAAPGRGPGGPGGAGVGASRLLRPERGRRGAGGGEGPARAGRVERPPEARPVPRRGPLGRDPDRPARSPPAGRSGRRR